MTARKISKIHIIVHSLFINEMPPLSNNRRYPKSAMSRVGRNISTEEYGYRVGLAGAALEYAVKKYKSHRRLSAPINLATLDEEYKTKKEK